MNDVRVASAQEWMIQTQVVDRGVRDPRVLEALRVIPRQRFFPQRRQDEAWSDQASPIGHGQTISQPYIVALMSERLSVGAEHDVLEIGTGSGYQTAILAKLAHEVFTAERIKPLLDEAFERLLQLDIRNVHFRWADGTEGWPGGKMFDRILISAGAPEIPRNLLLRQLRDGGIAVVPVGPLESQQLLEIHRRGDELEATEITACRFVKLIGQEGWATEE